MLARLLVQITFLLLIQADQLSHFRRIEKNGSHHPVCLLDLPSSLCFVESLNDSLKPSDIVIFSGGDSLHRRTSSFGRISSYALQKFAQHHGYQLVFLDELDYKKALVYRGYQYTHHWHRAFAMPSLRSRFPDAKYFVWLDDDILVTYPETDMLNHYINLMEWDEDWSMTYGDEGADFVLNSGMFIMKNNNLGFWAYEEAIKIGAENDGYLAKNFGHEQTAIIKVRERYKLEDVIVVIGHRHNQFNFNTFSRQDQPYDPPLLRYRPGDAFVHFTGMGNADREQGMLKIQFEVMRWRNTVEQYGCVYPIDLE